MTTAKAPRAATALHDRILARITPDDTERRRMSAAVRDLTAAVQRVLDEDGLAGAPSVQGSVAKDTWLQGATDIDCFLLMDPAVPAHELERVATRVGPRVLEGCRTKYAQHPYVIGDFAGYQVDLVPAYAVAEPGAKMSAVDRTPFHTAWVEEHLDGTQRSEVRLAKAWCRGVGVYGAETRIGGVSGYLVEVLVHHLGSFAAMLRWLADGAQPRRIAPAGDDELHDAAHDAAALIVVDPVDPTRNCAAAVRAEIVDLAGEAARAYLQTPDEAFFFPPPPRPEPAKVLRDALAAATASWLGIVLHPATDRLDIVFPQFQKTARQVAEDMERAGFAVRRHRVDAWDDDRRIGMQWVCSGTPLPPVRRHEGPSADAGDNADRFRAKWQGHEAASGPVREEGGRLVVDVDVPHRTPRDHVEAMARRLFATKHVKAAWRAGHRVLDDPTAATAEWAPAVADFVLDRRPWQR